MKKILFKQVIQKEMMLDDFLDLYYFSRKQKHLLKMEKRIIVNNNQITHNILLKQDDVIEIDCMKEEQDDLYAYPYDLEILYEDDVVLIINKPIHMIVHSDGNDIQTLDNAVQYYYQKTNQKCLVRHIHRLDRDTSGCILYCKCSYLQSYFDYMMSTKQINRTYLAIVQGKIEQEMTIHKNIGKDRHTNKYRVSKTGQNAITHIKPIKYKNNKTLISCQLETGRTHQIRVHLSSIRHPLIGDSLYGKSSNMRCALHSHWISFIHPITQKKIRITCDLPNDMKRCINE